MNHSSVHVECLCACTLSNGVYFERQSIRLCECLRVKKYTSCALYICLRVHMALAFEFLFFSSSSFLHYPGRPRQYLKRTKIFQIINRETSLLQVLAHSILRRDTVEAEKEQREALFLPPTFLLSSFLNILIPHNQTCILHSLGAPQTEPLYTS